MKWVKASERNPEKEGYYFSFRHHDRSYPQSTFWYADEKKWSSTTELWLDESAESDTEAELREHVRKLREGVWEILNITKDSSGVSGYYLNGAIAEWNEFPEIEQAKQLLTETEG